VLTIDASVFVAADAADEEARGSARALMARALASGADIHQPTITIVEVTSAIARRTGDPGHARTVGVEVLHLPRVVVHDLDTDVAAVAAGLASELRLRGADAVYAATALRAGTTLITLDAELAMRASAVVPTYTPADWLAHQAASRRLATYGSLAPGRPNHHQLAALRGVWREGHVRGRLIQAGWGAELGFPALVLDPDGVDVPVHVFESDDLPDHWARLDEHEGSDYRRVVVTVLTPEGELEASIYELAADAGP
jgi:gamma-glutamylcyclotransferase (GGCT)/AIG2-like uncharacterized protein YtfP/predicted nucleic acid-binding protein